MKTESSVLFAYSPPHQTPKHVVAKEIKKVIHTAYSFGINDITVFNLGDKFDFVPSCKVIEKDEQVPTEGLHVLLEPERALENIDYSTLPNFKHPDNCTYVIWSDYGTTPFMDFKDNKIVTIPMATEAPLWASITLGVVLYDRWVKNGCS